MTTAIVAILNKTEKYIIEKFRSKGAISINTLMCFDEIEINYRKNPLAKMALKKLLEGKVINVFEEKYWLDEELYKKRKKKSY